MKSCSVRCFITAASVSMIICGRLGAPNTARETESVKTGTTNRANAFELLTTPKARCWILFFLAHELQSAVVRPQRVKVTTIRAELFKSLPGLAKALNL